MSAEQCWDWPEEFRDIPLATVIIPPSDDGAIVFESEVVISSAATALTWSR
jgi:hypothetical protein